MDKNPLSKAALPKKLTETGAVTREGLRARARELAVIAGRVPPQVSQLDYEQAKRELTGESEGDRQDAILDSLPESKRWDPVPGSTGHQAQESPSEDEDDEGRSETEQLVEEGAVEAERDRAQQAAQTDNKSGARKP